MGAKLFIVGVPLQDGAPLSEAAKEVLPKCCVLIAESRKVTSRYLKQIPTLKPETPIFYLDNLQKAEERELNAALSRAHQNGESVALFSDTGMPILFDPGKEVLDPCRKLGFEIHSVPSATSWGTACAVSGFSPPFFLLGFPERDTAKRETQLRSLKSMQAHLVLMDTPYRFRALLEQCQKAFSPEREAFLAWEISAPQELYLWGRLRDLAKHAENRGLEKGEFVLIVKSP